MIENTFGKNIIPANEQERLKALHRYQITDTPSEESFDGIAQLAAQIFDVPVALISLVDAESVFFKANYGMGNAKKANRGKSLCSLAVLDNDVTVFEDALKEPCLLSNPNVIGDFGLRFYAGAPLITHDGHLIGTLCIIDQKTRTFDSRERKILQGLAKTAMDQIELRLSALETIEKLAHINDEAKEYNEKVNFANKKLEQSELRLKSFITKAPVAFGILHGKDLIIETANEMILKVWRKDRDVIGKPIKEALPELKDQPYFDILANVLETGIPFLGNTAKAILEDNGVLHEAWFDFIYEPLKDESGNTTSIIVIANEVTDRINKRDELENLNQRYELALKAGQLGTYTLDLKTGKMICSDVCKSNYGKSKDDRFDFEDFIESVVPEHRKPVLAKINESIKDAKPYNSEYLIQRPDGSFLWMNASGLPSYDEDGNPAFMTGVTTDVTKRKNYETQKDDFLSIASHELKTPITSLKASIQLLYRLKHKPTHEKIPKLIEQSARSIEKLTVLVDDLLNLNRLSGGKMELLKSEFTVSEMLESCCEFVRLTDSHTVKITGDLEIKAFADEDRIDQVVVNLLNNAVKYASHSNEICLNVEKSDGFIKIGVQDFGDGIDEDVQPYLFERYFRANHEKKQYSGLGLGLYISSEIVKRHGGEIGVDSTKGKGSTFWFTLPV
ncbi:ATP-binding protein [Chryseobacterium caseinilyticum]|uniref:histidine kinase n=1 Tax=Chryseobacterium caseinilyticum TaxID=2771428 RepID=A0ABR8Z9G5_9FLAO|nr:ATP-binding protein [Chryseobacterium caseinilyticum]MBD8081523.1 PAS domain-containing protein [Chryseobacterium caseinilyticum]